MAIDISRQVAAIPATTRELQKSNKHKGAIMSRIISSGSFVILLFACTCRIYGQISDIKPALSGYTAGKVYLVPDDTFNFKLWVWSSLYEITEVKAVMEGKSYSLSLTQNANGYDMYSGKIPLLGKAQKNYTITYSATDFGNNSKTDSMVIRYDHLPTLQVFEPGEYLVSDNLVHLKATCSDTPCVGCKIDVLSYITNIPGILCSAYGSVDTVFKISSSYPSTKISFVATDSAGQKDTVSRRVGYLSQEDINPVDTIDLNVGKISKYYVLGHDDNEDCTCICDRETGVITPIRDVSPVLCDGHFYLTVKYISGDLCYLIVNHNGKTDTLTKKANDNSFSTSDKFVAWIDDNGLKIYNVETDSTTSVVGRIIGYCYTAVSPDGEVYYYDTAYVKYFNGKKTVTLDTSLLVTEVHTNGKLATWLINAGDSKSDLMIYNHDSIYTIPSTLGNTIICDSIVAFEKASNSGVRQVWVWNPKGTVSQETGETSYSSLVAVSPDKYLIVERNSNIYIQNPQHKSRLLWSSSVYAPNKPKWVYDNFYTSSSGVVFTVDTSFGSTSANNRHVEPSVSKFKISIRNGSLSFTGIGNEERIEECMLVDVSGRTVRLFTAGTFSNKSSSALSLKGIGAGKYFLRIKTDSHVYCSPVISIKG